MMNAVSIFVEGNDYKFVQDFVKYHYDQVLPLGDIGGIIETKGWEKLKNFAQKMREYTDQGLKNLVIFDADYPQEGGFEKRLAQIEAIKSEIQVDFEIFLFPNHQANGTLETLLLQLINPRKRIILDCWQNYEQCLQQHSEHSFTLPSSKSKIYSYLEVQLPDTKEGKKFAKDRERNFLNPDHWHLDSEASLPFKQFLDNYLINPA